MSSAKAWFPYRRHASRVEIFGFPHAGAGSTVFSALRAAMAEHELALVPAVLPGRERRLRERPFRDLDGLLADFEAMAEDADFAPFGGDYALLGHCSGALLAYEVARILESSPCRPPKLLVVSGCLPPPLVRDTGTSALATPDLFARTADLGGTEPTLLDDPDFLDMLERPLRADWTWFDQYIHQHTTPIRTPVLAVRGNADENVSSAQLQQWRAHTTGRFTALEQPTGHWPLTGDGPVAIAAEVAAVLDGAVLDEAVLDGAVLDGAVLDRAVLDGASQAG